MSRSWGLVETATLLVIATPFFPSIVSVPLLGASYVPNIVMSTLHHNSQPPDALVGAARAPKPLS